MKFITLFVLLCVCFVSNYANGKMNTTDNNYEYITQSDASFKFHQTHAKFSDAKTTCENEGGSLFYPETEYELNAVISVLQNKYKETFPQELLLGMVKSENGFETIDGLSVTKVFTKWKPGEPNNAGDEKCVVLIYPSLMMNDVPCNLEYAFICKWHKTEWSEQCHIPNLDYGYSEELGKCYKFHLTPKTWSQAQEKCRAEQSQLAVINSQEEAAYLVRLTRKTLYNVPGRFSRGVVLLGFHNNNVEDWQTIEGTSLYYSGYACWGNSQPDGGERDRCGSMFYNGHLNDIGCDQKAFFICEQDNAALNYVHEPRSFYNVIQSVRCHDTI